MTTAPLFLWYCGSYLYYFLMAQTISKNTEQWLFLAEYPINTW